MQQWNATIRNQVINKKEPRRWSKIWALQIFIKTTAVFEPEQLYTTLYLSCILAVNTAIALFCPSLYMHHLCISNKVYFWNIQNSSVHGFYRNCFTGARANLRHKNKPFTKLECDAAYTAVFSLCKSTPTSTMSSSNSNQKPWLFTMVI